MQTQQAGSSVVVPQPSEGRLPVVGRRRRRRIREEAQWKIHLEKGTGLIADQQYRAALVELSQAVAESPDDNLAECYAIRSQAYLYNADYDRAIDDCNLSIKLDPIQADVFACRGSALAHQKQWRQALDDFFTAIRFRPDADERYRPVLLEHIDSAMAEFEELIRTDQADGHLYQTRGMARAYRGEHRQAVRDFAAALKMGMKESLTYLNRAECYRALGKHTHVVHDCNHAVKLGETSAAVFHMRGHALRELGKRELAVADLTRAINRGLRSAEAYFERGQLQEQLDEPLAALDDYSSAIHIAPESRFDKARAELYETLGAYSDAAIDWGSVIERDAADIASRLKRGEIYLLLDKHDSALKDFRAVLTLDPINVRAIRGCGSAETGRGNHDKAVELLTKAIRVDARYVEAYGSRGDAFQALGQHSEAVQDYTAAIDLDGEAKNIADVYYRRGLAYLDLEEFIQTDDDLTFVVLRRPRDADAFLWRGTARANLERWRDGMQDLYHSIELEPWREDEFREVGQPLAEEALAILDESIEHQAKDSHLLCDRAAVYRYLEDAESAQEDYTSALKVAVDEVEVSLLRAAFLAHQQRHEDAIQDCDRALELDDQNGAAFHQRAISRHALDQHAPAAEDLNKALQLDDANPQYLLTRGVVLLARAKKKAAHADLARSVELDPLCAEAYCHRGRALLALDRPKEALEDLTTTIKMHPHYAEAHLHRGKALVRLRKYAEALEDVDRALELEPDYPDAYICRGTTLARMHRYQHAVIELTKVAGRMLIDERYIAVLECRARVFYSMAQYRLARIDFSTVIDVGAQRHDYFRARYGRGLTYLRLRQQDEAARDLADAVKLQPKHARACQALDWCRGKIKNPPPDVAAKSKIIRLVVPPVIGVPIPLPEDDDRWSDDPSFDSWLVRASDEAEYGPFTKSKLDQWCREGRLDNDMFVFRMDWDEWYHVGDVYVQHTMETHRVSNRPIPLEMLPEEEPDEEEPDDEMFPGIDVE